MPLWRGTSAEDRRVVVGSDIDVKLDAWGIGLLVLSE